MVLSSQEARKRTKHSSEEMKPGKQDGDHEQMHGGNSKGSQDTLDTSHGYLLSGKAFNPETEAPGTSITEALLLYGPVT